MQSRESRSLTSDMPKAKANMKINDIVSCEWVVGDYIRGYSSQTCVKYNYNYQECVTYYLEEEGKSVNKITSPTFLHTNSSEWCMELSRDGSGLLLQFCLLSSQGDPSAKAEVKASYLSDSGLIVNFYNTEIVSLKTPQNSLQKRVNFDRYSDLCIIGEVSTPAETTQGCKSGSFYRELQHVTNDLGALLTSGDLSDVVLCSGDKEFKAHRAVLCARSPVLSAMLRHDTSEAQTGMILIEDVDSDTLREVLNYIYTGKVPFINKFADTMLVAADKYDLQNLKKLCELELARNLTVLNAAATSVLAITHSCNFLKMSAVRFIKNNFVDVLGTEGWVGAVKHHADTVIEMSRLITNKLHTHEVVS